MHQIQATHSVARQTALGAVIGVGFGIFATGSSLLSSGFGDTVVLMAVPLILAFAVLGGGVTGSLGLFRAEEASEAPAANRDEEFQAAIWDGDDARHEPAA